MKILYVTTIGGTMRFFKKFIGKLLAEGHTVDIACNETISKVQQYYRDCGCKVSQITCTRSPFNKGTIKAIGEIKRLVNENQYDIVHCHTPIAAMCTRLACIKARKKGTKVFYTAHGFHFYKGAPIKNWLVYYPVEKLCAYFTDVLITINREDYALAQKKLKAKKVEYVPGVGIDLKTFSTSTISKEQKRKELAIPTDSKLLLSVGELNSNKNHQIVIRAIAELGQANIHYIIAGEGETREALITLAKKLQIEKQVHLLGYRKDVYELYKAADIYIHPSFREGLPVAVMEAMASGLPVVCSKIRGNSDLVDEISGLLFEPSNTQKCKNAIENIIAADIKSIGKNNLEKANEFSCKMVNNRMFEIYRGING